MKNKIMNVNRHANAVIDYSTKYSEHNNKAQTTKILNSITVDIMTPPNENIEKNEMETTLVNDASILAMTLKRSSA